MSTIATSSSRAASGSGRILSARRALLCLAAGAVADALVGLAWSPILAPLAGWLVAAGSAMAWVWSIGWPQDAEVTERLAEEESRSRSTDTWVLLACVASRAAVVVALVQSSSRQDGTAVAAVLLSVLGAILAWALVNTVFALKYARMYYVDEPDRGGIDFHSDKPPCYADFAYMAFTVGMSFGVSETQPNTTATRKVALGHALLSYAFGTGVLAVAINLVTNLGQ
ncbi:DUF1345 domain-containing protein [Rothia sp. ARF10]|nr:DUF1345 domain-containing protein [Rothia sp. ARF10]